MKLLLVQPRLPDSFWSFRWAFDRIARDKSALVSPLGLATLAALTPGHWQVTIVDENVEAIDFDADADVVGVGGMAVQYPRQCEIAAAFRDRGRHVVVGGPYASLCPEQYVEVADTVVCGEAERIWPRFCDDFDRGRPSSLYRETDSVDLAETPTPRHDLLRLDRYQSVAVQFSRGCPFRCEFCDIIVVFGRKPRTKSLLQVERELDLLRSLGVRQVFFIDDNLIGHLPRCRELLDFLIEYQRRHRYCFVFGAEASANLAGVEGLLARMRRANFAWIFIGLETPSREALAETRKDQNNRADAVGTVRAAYAQGIDVYASFVVGFDADGPDIFDRQAAFIAEAGIVIASVAMLLALPRTPLYERLGKAGRLKRSSGEAHELWNNLIATNVVPLQMTEAEMRAGFFDLLEELSCDASIARRIDAKLAHWGKSPADLPLSLGTMTRYLFRFILFGVMPGGPMRWWRVLRSLLRRPGMLPMVVQCWTAGWAIQAFLRGHLARHAAEPRSRLACPADAPRPAGSLSLIR